MYQTLKNFGAVTIITVLKLENIVLACLFRTILVFLFAAYTEKTYIDIFLKTAEQGGAANPQKTRLADLCVMIKYKMNDKDAYIPASGFK